MVLPGADDRKYAGAVNNNKTHHGRPRGASKKPRYAAQNTLTQLSGRQAPPKCCRVTLHWGFLKMLLPASGLDY